MRSGMVSMLSMVTAAMGFPGSPWCLAFHSGEPGCEPLLSRWYRGEALKEAAIPAKKTYRPKMRVAILCREGGRCIWGGRRASLACDRPGYARSTHTRATETK